MEERVIPAPEGPKRPWAVIQDIMDGCPEIDKVWGLHNTYEEAQRQAYGLQGYRGISVVLASDTLIEYTAKGWLPRRRLIAEPITANRIVEAARYGDVVAGYIDGQPILLDTKDLGLGQRYAFLREWDRSRLGPHFLSVRNGQWCEEYAPWYNDEYRSTGFEWIWFNEG